MSRLIKSEAIVIHSIRWHETSKIVTFYSRQKGIIKAIARGALRKNSQMGGLLESLNHVQIVISEKESRDLQIITQVYLINPFTDLKSDLKRLPYAMAISELIKKIFESGQKDEIFFDFVIRILDALSNAPQPEIVFWYFMLKLASFLGFKPDFKACASCGKSEFKKSALFVFKEGALYCTECTGTVEYSIKLTDREIDFLRRLQSYPHRKIHEFRSDYRFNVDFTSLLIRYLNFHLQHEITLESLYLLADS
ncbi:MAG: DNA repair protein RecO [Calditrichaeota bacterium]|nr:DNA repair protein RecO [Calditrichota bacterium]